jgi:hypothetical protein
MTAAIEQDERDLARRTLISRDENKEIWRFSVVVAYREADAESKVVSNRIWLKWVRNIETTAIHAICLDWMTVVGGGMPVTCCLAVRLSDEAT